MKKCDYCDQQSEVFRMLEIPTEDSTIEVEVCEKCHDLYCSDDNDFISLENETENFQNQQQIVNGFHYKGEL